MKNSLKSKITHLFKGKTNKLEKFPTYDQSYKAEQCKLEAKNKSKEDKIHKNKKNHKRVKADIKGLNTNNLKEFPTIPSPTDDSNESSKLTAQEFAKAVGIKILHRTDEEEDEDCDCEYCKTAYSNINTITSMDPNIIDNNAPTQPIPNVALNQYTVNTASIFSSNSTTFGNNEDHIDIPPLPSFNFNSGEKLIKCSSNTSLNTSASNNHSFINSRTIGTPGYYCHRNSRKNSISKVIDMSMFVPPSEQEIKSRGVQSSSLSINSTPEPNAIQAIPPPSNEMIMGGSLDRNRNTCQKKTYCGLTQSNSTRERARSHSVANNKSRVINNNTEIKASPVIRESSNGSSSRIQFKIHNRRNSQIEFSTNNTYSNPNANSNIIPSSPNKRPLPASLASSTSSTTLSSSLSLTHISKTNLNSIPSSQSSSQASIQKPTENSLLSSKNLSSKSLNSIKSPLSSSSSLTPIKPHTSLKITRSVTISEGTRRRTEIDVKPIEKDEVRVYTKGRFTITCEHSRRLSGQKFQFK